MFRIRFAMVLGTTEPKCLNAIAGLDSGYLHLHRHAAGRGVLLRIAATGVAANPLFNPARILPPEFLINDAQNFLAIFCLLKICRHLEHIVLADGLNFHVDEVLPHFL